MSQPRTRGPKSGGGTVIGPGTGSPTSPDVLRGPQVPREQTDGQNAAGQT